MEDAVTQDLHGSQRKAAGYGQTLRVVGARQAAPRGGPGGIGVAIVLTKGSITLSTKHVFGGSH